MTRLKNWHRVLVFCAAMAIASPAQTFTTLASFQYFQTGASPQFMSLAQGSDGNFYGTARDGGGVGYGTVFELTPGGTLSLLYDFCRAQGCSDGGFPFAGLIQAGNGVLYGITSEGGANGTGTVFEVTVTDGLTFLCQFGFAGCPDGGHPFAGLIRAADGNFYGTAWQGNASGSSVVSGSGTVFEITAGREPMTLYGFCSQTNCADGGDPFAPLVQAASGTLYGTTFNGGAKGYGTVYAITTSGTLTTLHSFHYADGAGPVAGLIQAKNGNFYGTTLYGGAHDAGTVFEITPAGKLKTLHSFGAGGDGAYPYAALLQATDGNFYGTTHDGGAHGHGTVFRITTSGQLSTLSSFCSQKKCADGAFPYAGLIQASDGNLYGAASKGGASNWGTLYAITLAGQLSTLHSFCSQKNCIDGADPVGGLMQAADGNLYGTTAEGGDKENGTVFRLSLGVDQAVETLSATSEPASESLAPKQLPSHASQTRLPWLRRRLPHFDASVHAPAPIQKPGGFNCSPAPCMLPPTQASEGGGIVTDPLIATNPLNQKELLLGSYDANCSGSVLGFHLSRDGGSTWNRTLCMPFIYTKHFVYIPIFEPAVGYDRKGNAYAAGFYDDNKSGTRGFLAVQRSSDGTHWNQPVVALRHLPIWTSLTVDISPGSPRVNSVYVSGVIEVQRKTEVLVSHSTDGGKSWTQVAVDALQKFPAADNFTRMTVSKDGTVYVTWVRCPAAGPDKFCSDGTGYRMFSKSTDGGNTWSPPGLMTKVAMPPLDQAPNTMKGERVINYPVIAVDDSNGQYSGNLYVAINTWTGTDLRAQVIRSSDGGKTWSKPVPVAPPTATHDQFFPTVSVSPKGLVGVSWLDRRNDPGDLNYQACAAISTDGGKTFQKNWQLTKAFSNPDTNGAYNWMGDYAGNTWAGNKFIAAWMDSSNGIDMQEVVGGVRLK